MIIKGSFSTLDRQIWEYLMQVCPMLETGKFAYHLRTLLKLSKNKRIISNDSIEKAIETLKSEAIVEDRTIP